MINLIDFDFESLLTCITDFMFDRHGYIFVSGDICIGREVPKVPFVIMPFGNNPGKRFLSFHFFMNGNETVYSYISRLLVNVSAIDRVIGDFDMKALEDEVFAEGRPEHTLEKEFLEKYADITKNILDPEFSSELMKPLEDYLNDRIITNEVNFKEDIPSSKGTDEHQYLS